MGKTSFELTSAFNTGLKGLNTKVKTMSKIPRPGQSALEGQHGSSNFPRSANKM